MDKRAIALLLLKQANVVGGVLAAGKGFLGSGKHISKTMAKSGVTSPLAHAAAKATPYAVAVYGGKRAYESDTAQKLKYRVALYKHRKAMKQQQQQQGGR